MTLSETVTVVVVVILFSITIHGVINDVNKIEKRLDKIEQCTK